MRFHRNRSHVIDLIFPLAVLFVFAASSLVVLILSVHIYNYCPEPLKFADGLPITTKADKRAHGYGVKIIRMITEKYGGEMSMSQKDDIFNLDLLFPLDK